MPFSKVGLEALCDRSISPKRGLDFIGSKGIGFKSALNWTDSPRIISGSIRAAFDRSKSRQLILSRLNPSAIAELTNEHRWNERQIPLLRLPFDHEPDDIENELLEDGWPTVVTLPLLDGCLKELAVTLAGFDKNCLLFLKHLRRIEFDCDQLNGVVEVRGKAKGPGIREIEVCDSTRTPEVKSPFLVFHKPLEVRPSDTKELGKAEIAIGVPLLPADEHQNDAPIYNFFPTLTASPIPRIFLHATFLVTPDRNGLRNDDLPYQEALLSALVELLTGQVLPELGRRIECEALRYIKLTTEPPTHNPLLRDFWKNLTAAIAATPFVRTLAETLIAPARALLWNYSLDKVVCRGNRSAPLAKLTAPDWQIGPFRAVLKSFGARELSAKQHIEVLESWEALSDEDSIQAIDLLFIVAKAAGGYAVHELDAPLSKVKLWRTASGRTRALMGDVPFFENVPETLPLFTWLSFDTLSKRVRDSWLNDAARQEISATGLKQLASKYLHKFTPSGFANEALVSALSGKNSAWWRANGHDALQVFGMLSLTSNDEFVWTSSTRSKLSKLVHLPESKSTWKPAWTFYAGVSWSSDLGEHLGKTLANRQLIPEPSTKDLAGLEKPQLQYLGVSWGPKLLHADPLSASWHQEFTNTSFRSTRLEELWRLYLQKVFLQKLSTDDRSIGGGIGRWRIETLVGYEGLAEAAGTTKTHSVLLSLLKDLLEAVPEDSANIRIRREGPREGYKAPFVLVRQSSFLAWQIKALQIFRMPESALLSYETVAIKESFLNLSTQRPWRRWLPVLNLDDVEDDAKPHLLSFAVTMGAHAKFTDIPEQLWINWLTELHRKMQAGAELTASALGGFLHDLAEALKDQNLATVPVLLPGRRSAGSVEFLPITQLHIIDQQRLQYLRDALFEAGVPLLLVELEDGKRIAKVFGGENQLLSRVLHFTVQDGAVAHATERVRRALSQRAPVAAFLAQLSSKAGAERFAAGRIDISVFGGLTTQIRLSSKDLGVHAIPYVVDGDRICVDQESLWDNVANALLSWLQIRLPIEDGLVRLLEVLDKPKNQDQIVKLLSTKGITEDALNAWHDHLGESRSNTYNDAVLATRKKQPQEFDSQKEKTATKDAAKDSQPSDESHPRDTATTKSAETTQESKDENVDRAEQRKRETKGGIDSTRPQVHQSHDADRSRQRPGISDRRIEKGDEAETWFVEQLRMCVPAGWRVTERGGGSSPFDVEISNGSRAVFVEVKLDSAAFFLTENEIAFATARKDSYVLALVGDAAPGEPRSIRWLLTPLNDCATYVSGGTWLYQKEVLHSAPVVGWTVPEPRPVSGSVVPSFRFQVTVPADKVLPKGWPPLLRILETKSANLGA